MTEPLPSRSLPAWLLELERRHPQAIELGLDRVGRVWRALGAPRPAPRVLTVGGTNGKGSTVAFVEAAARALGWRVGCYTSPHIERYNERVRIDGVDATDAELVAAFDRIEAARAGVALTYFETGTLAAFLLLADAGLDLAVLEVGLGGRLDAVNLVGADASVVTTVALDHQDWLGDTREAIAVEKAAIARAGRPLLVGERDPSPALLAAVAAIGAQPWRLGDAFDCRSDAGGGRWLHLPGRPPLAMPARLPLAAPVQWDNAATALAALVALAPGIDAGRAIAGLAGARAPGRLQQVGAAPAIVLDVGHNPQAAAALAQWLAQAEPAGRTVAVFSALADKDIAAIVRPLLPWVACWHLAGLDRSSPRGLAVAALSGRLDGVLPAAHTRSHHDVAAALSAARRDAGSTGRVLVFGSFHTVAEALRALAAG
jgi:dihydrofolate synthase/folylpolyglutamate synthase